MPVPLPRPDARAVVTGASQGIGEALATELAKRGHHLIITARREDVLREVADRITDRYGVTVEVRPIDLTDADDRAALAEELAGRNISILCNNAGTATFGPVAALDPEGEKKQVALNVVAVHDLTLAVMPGMIGRGAGGIFDLRLGRGQFADPEQCHLRGQQGVRQHVQRVAARRGEEGRHPCDSAGARPGARRDARSDRGVTGGQVDPRFPVDLG